MRVTHAKRRTRVAIIRFLTLRARCAASGDSNTDPRHTAALKLQAFLKKGASLLETSLKG
jgi:hypothetical protein